MLSKEKLGLNNDLLSDVIMHRNVRNEVVV